MMTNPFAYRTRKPIIVLFFLVVVCIHFQFPITALREIRILQLLKHENVVNLIEICRTKPSPNNRHRSTFYLVFDFCEHDLAGLLSNEKVTFTLGEIKKVMQQLLNGLYYIHYSKVRGSFFIIKIKKKKRKKTNKQILIIFVVLI